MDKLDLQRYEDLVHDKTDMWKRMDYFLTCLGLIAYPNKKQNRFLHYNTSKNKYQIT